MQSKNFTTIRSHIVFVFFFIINNNNTDYELQEYCKFFKPTIHHKNLEKKTHHIHMHIYSQHWHKLLVLLNLHLLVFHYHLLQYIRRYFIVSFVHVLRREDLDSNVLMSHVAHVGSDHSRSRAAIRPLWLWLWLWLCDRDQTSLCASAPCDWCEVDTKHKHSK